MTHEQPALADLLGQWVTATNPVDGAVWVGQLVALADHPTLILNSPGGGQVSLPQTFAVHPAAEPAQPAGEDSSAPRPFLELRDTGLLWLINRVALHPRGLSLALHVSGSGDVLGWSLLRNDDNEPWSFDPATDSDGHARAEATLAAALAAPPDDRPDSPDRHGGTARTGLVGEDRPDCGAFATSADSVRTGSDNGPADNDGGVRVEYSARVPRHQLGAAVAEAFGAINEATAHKKPASSSPPGSWPPAAADGA